MNLIQCLKDYYSTLVFYSLQQQHLPQNLLNQQWRKQSQFPLPSVSIDLNEVYALPFTDQSK